MRPLIIFILAASFALADEVADFALPDAKGKTRKLSDFADKIVVLEWTNFQCPCVKKHYDSRKMQLLQKHAGSKDVVWLTICSSPEGTRGYFTARFVNKIVDGIGAKPTAYLCDEAGKVAEQFGVKFTPHMVILSKDRKILYSGLVSNEQEVEANPDVAPVNFFSNALESVLAGKAAKPGNAVQVGCPIPVKATPAPAIPSQ